MDVPRNFIGMRDDIFRNAMGAGLKPIYYHTLLVIGSYRGHKIGMECNHDLFMEKWENILKFY